MKYSGDPDYQHGRAPGVGVLLANLGTPRAATATALRPYLAEFLTDPRVIELPALLWRPILHGIILRLRPRRSARIYQKIWQKEGSPLLTLSRKQQQALQQALERRCAGPVYVELGMRYGEPSIRTALERLRDAHVRRLLVLPLYPQYCAATTASTFDAVSAVLRRWRWLPELRMVLNYHDHPAYIRTLADSIRPHWERHRDHATRLLFSFHGIPRHYFDAGDPYHCECWKTARLSAQALGLAEGQWGLGFQSRFGPREWLQPYTDQVLQEWAGSGVRSVQVVCPGFSADCLETLEEVQMQYRDCFLKAGGQEFDYIPALNDQHAHINFLCGLVLEHTQGWPDFSATRDREAERRERERSRELALGKGAKR